MKIECKNKSWRRKKAKDYAEDKRDELTKIHYFTINKYKTLMIITLVLITTNNRSITFLFIVYFYYLILSSAHCLLLLSSIIYRRKLQIEQISILATIVIMRIQV